MFVQNKLNSERGQFTQNAPFWVKDVARAETLMGSRLHVPDMVGSFMRSMRDDVQAESSP